MIYLLFGIAANIGMSFVMRYSESHSGNRYGVTVFNYATGLLLSWMLLEEKNVFAVGEIDRFTLLLALLNGVLFVVCLLLMQHNIAKNGVPMTATFNRLGILIPTVLSAIFFNEIPGLFQIIGLVLAVFAIIHINGGFHPSGGKVSRDLLFLFVAGGCVDMVSKVFGQLGRAENQNLFVMLTFAFGLAISIAVLLIKDRKITKGDMIVGVMVGIPNQLASLFLLKAVSVLPAYLAFPMYSAGIIVAVNIINFAVFKEKLSPREYIGTAIIALALVFINL